MQNIGHFIGGQSVDVAGRTGAVYNPATGEQSGAVAMAGRDDLDHAVQVATEAGKAWRVAPLATRQKIMFAFRQIVDSRRDELAAIITAEQGKVLSDAAGEVARGMENVDWCCNLMHHLKGEFSPQVSRGIDVHSRREALGVVACITPFNFPAMIPMWMAVTAIACGNAVVLKPSERDPSASNWIAERFAEAGLPAGVLNVLHGDADTVQGILEHPGIAAVSFVGSTPIAEKIYKEAAANGKRVQALGGAKNHMVVMPDADLDSAADAAVSSAYGAAGERCMAVSVLVAVESIADDLVNRIAQRIPNLKVGAGDAEGTDMGPLITSQARERVSGFVGGASGEGATVVVDGRQQEFEGDGFFIGASLVDNVKPGMKVYDEEIFGPVLSVVRVKNYDEAVALVNASQFANGVAIFTRDGKTAREFEGDIEVGMVGVNVPIPVPVGSFSFGGWKKSLFGDAHMYGREGFDFYTRRKVVTSRWPEPSESQINLGFPTH